jgi:cobalamin biosynthetic protein CobC
MTSSAGFAHHGGRLGAARSSYADAPQPWIDLSTGINPRSYPAPRPSGVELNRLPDVGELARLEATAAASFGVDDPRRVVALGGTEPGLRLLPYLLGLTNAVVAGPTYGSHADGWQRAGVATRVVPDALLEESIGDRTGVIVVNPNNPDGRLMDAQRLQRLRGLAAGRGGVLVVDEAFAEVVPGWSVAGLVGTSGWEGTVVLRSFGKFYGLAGVRLGFIVGDVVLADRVRGAVGDWPVGVAGLKAGLAAYADSEWGERTRLQLARAARRLDALLAKHGFEVVGGTALYRLVRAEDAAARFERLAAAGILTRPFRHDRSLLRFGLPWGGKAWRRLELVLAGDGTAAGAGAGAGAGNGPGTG